MFKFLKDKLKGALDKFSKKVEDEAPEEEVIVEKKVKVRVSKLENPKDKPKEIRKQSPKKIEVTEAPKIIVKEEIKSEPVKVKEKVKTTEEPKIIVKEGVTPLPLIVEEKGEEKIIEKIEVKESVKSVPVKVEEKVVQKIEAKPEIKPAPIKVEEKPEPKKGFFSRLKSKIVGEEKPAKPEDSNVEIKKEVKVQVAKPQEQAQGFFKRITQKVTTKKISLKQFDDLFWDLEVALLENNVAIEVIEKIREDLKGNLVDKLVPRSEVANIVGQSLHSSINDLFMIPSLDILKLTEEKKPLVIAFVGINGSGKTTSIAKVTKYFLDNGKSVVLAAADTFRAAAIDQLQLHADKLKVKMIRHEYGSDPAAVAFDAVAHAKATRKDVVLIDTAGRLHSNINLVDEMKKIMRVSKPDLKIFVGESITGNDCVEQAKKFDEAVGLDGIILSKADIDEKGGAAISVSYVTKKPILFLGVGQEYDDLQVFSKEKILSSIGL